jgi:SpoIVB peptidase S55
MRSLLSLALVGLLLLTISFAADTTQEPKILPVDQIQPGMKGVAYTVFEGTKPEAMDLEVLGVLKNANGPKSDLILVRLKGTKPEYTGVVAGMSGSPVYIDGKLVGALSYRIGQFSKEPIAGVTPIAQMLEINELDKSMPADALSGNGAPKNQASKTSVGASIEQPLNNYANLLTPIEAPLVFSGFSEDALRKFSPQFASAGVIPVMGAGSASNEKQPEPIEPGSSVSAILVRGDMDIAATCTVTYYDAERLLACGHPLMQFGQVQMPMTKSRVVATLPSPMNAFKIVNTTESIGSFVQDRKTGILGRFNQVPRMVPVTLTIRSGQKQKEFHYEVLNNSKLTPVAMMATFYNALQGVNEYGEETTYRLNGHIGVAGFPDVSLQNMFAPLDGGMPTAYAVALSLGDRFSRVFDNPTSTPDIKSVDLDVELVNERRWLRLETARTDITEARPGDDIILEAVLRPYRGERIVRQIPIKIPTSTPRGSLRILVSDGETLDRMRRVSAGLGRKMDLGTTIALLNKEHANHRLYVSMLEANPQAMVEDKVMPTLPLSVMNVMDGMRGTQDMIVTGESAVNESSTPFDYVVTGSQVITVNVK